MKYNTFFIPIFIFFTSSVLAQVIQQPVSSDDEGEIISTTSTINNNFASTTPSPKAVVQDQALQELQKILDELDALQFGLTPHQNKKQQPFSLNELQATVPQQHQQINQQDKKQEQQEQRKPSELFSSLPRSPISSRPQLHQALSGIETFKLLQEQLNLISRVINLLFAFLFSTFFIFVFFVLIIFYLLVRIRKLENIQLV
ncbi:hypothetical protein BDC45DRAFT_81049 [Circinella umbellata]|nr:hypothetical protein BDC45DRAFT_81049 [Circinella umbellata]